MIQQVDFFLARLQQSLADPADFDGAKQSRVLKDGNTLAVLSLALAMHDEPHALKSAAPAMLEASQRLATAEDRYDRASKALAQLKAARENKQPSPGNSANISWHRVAALAPLMKQVPLIYGGLQRSVEGGRLARQADQAAGQAAALATIAAESAFSSDELAPGADVRKWVQFCTEMRDAAGEINSAVRAQDAAGARSGMARLERSCQACHAVFRKEM